jgi:CubicO group peptidase (beta-lactamase class C family)
VALALGADLVCEPGSRAVYNNKAVNLLGPIVKAASGHRLDAYVRDEIFAPLGIHEFEWGIDAIGHTQCMAGLVIRPQDLAKIGQMMLDGGVWEGQRIVSADWIARSTTNAGGSDHGLLWWPIAAEPQEPAPDEEDAIAKGEGELPPVRGPIVGFAAKGYLGQYLVVIPRDRIVAVRMKRTPKGYDGHPIDTFREFPRLVAGLTGRGGG